MDNTPQNLGIIAKIGAMLVAVLTLTACTETPAELEEGDGVLGEWVWSGGAQRLYVLHLSPGYNASQPAPLLIALHGAEQTGAELQQHTQLDHATDPAGFITAYPDAAFKSWAVGINLTKTDIYGGIDDVRFIRTLIGHLIEQLNVDPDRVYVTGLSQGALMTYRLACTIGGLLAGVGPVAATMPILVDEQCDPTPAVPILMIHGTNDRFFPWDGDVALLSMDRTVGTWAAHNGCRGDPERETLPDIEDDSTTVRTERYSDCTNQAEVTLFAIEGGGHTWPGAPFRFAGTGVLSREISASTELVTFFERHVRGGS